MCNSPDLATLLFRWEITIVILGCLIILVTTAMLGMRVRGGKRSRRAAYWMTIIMPLFQFPASAIRLFYSFRPSFHLSDPMTAYIDLFWSPVCTLLIIWFYRRHLVYCRACRLDVARQNIVGFIDTRTVFLALAAGFLTSFLLRALFVAEPESMIGLFYILTTLACTGAMAEIVLGKLVYGKVCLISYSWYWYLGSWTYFVTRM